METKMRGKTNNTSQINLFKSHFDQLLNQQHPLVILADKINWNRFELSLADCYSIDNGRPAKDIRLMVGLLYLKYTFSISDENLPLLWVENPYWQYFCGFSYMQHKLPLEYTTLIKWRKRIGVEKLKELLKETINIALEEKYVAEKDLSSVTVDTTVQEKNITYPTDGKLLCKAIEKLGKEAKAHGINLRQSFIRISKKLSIKAARYAHARQFKRMRRSLKKLRTFLGRLIRDVRRKVKTPDATFEELLTLCERLHEQKIKSKNKVYSMHEADVQCISKGKAHKRYEFGGKVTVATTNKNNWVICSDALEGNPYDGHTLADAIKSIESLTTVPVKEVFVDKGYRGHDYKGEADVHICGQGKNCSWSLKKRKKRRSAVEPKIGHLKSDNRMGRCFLKGNTGDAINAILAAAGSNMQKLLKLLGKFLFQIFSELKRRECLNKNIFSWIFCELYPYCW
jgi:IS5 family transposase